MAASPADHESELAFVIERRRRTRQMNRIARPGDTARLLVEEHRKLGTLHPGFFDVVRVIQPDCEKLGWPRDRRLELDAGQRNPMRGIFRGARSAVECTRSRFEKRDHLRGKSVAAAARSTIESSTTTPIRVAPPWVNVASF